MAWGRFEVCLLALEPMLFPIAQCCQSIPRDFIFTNNLFPYCKSTTYMFNRQHALMQAKKLILPTWTKGNLSEGDEVAQRMQGNTEDSGLHFTEATVAWSSWYQNQIDTATEGGRSPSTPLFLQIPGRQSRGASLTSISVLWLRKAGCSVDGSFKTIHIWGAEFSQKEAGEAFCGRGKMLSMPNQTMFPQDSL